MWVAILCWWIFDDADELLARTPEKLREAGIDLNIFREVVEVDSESKKIKVKI